MTKKFFNVAGPCDPRRHYMLPPEARLPDVGELIEQAQFFTLHAARQSGKTTVLQNFTGRINAANEYHALYCSLEALQWVEDPEKGIPIVLDCLREAIRYSPSLSAKLKLFSEPLDSGFALMLKEVLTRLCAALDRPLVIFFDEADCLSEGTLVSFLRQLRDGYVNRLNIPFVHSLALVGMRDIRDFKAKIRDGRDTLGSASPFNIVTESLTLTNFTLEEVSELYGQHTSETGQPFEPAASAKSFELSQGQPWLVNAIARESTVKIMRGDTAKPVSAEIVEQAAMNIILRRDTHIDSLLERLKESRVRRIVEPMIIGKQGAIDMLDDDYRYCVDLGLIRRSSDGIEPSNPIYGEVMLRTLSLDAQDELDGAGYDLPRPKYLLPDGGLDMDVLLRDFQGFWRENSEIWVERFEYREAAPHLILMAFLQRIVNGGGKVLREMATGRLRLDICAEMGSLRYPVELKLNYGPKTIPDGLTQLSRYMDRLGCSNGWLVVFDTNSSKSWDERINWRTECLPNCRTIHVVGC